MCQTYLIRLGCPLPYQEEVHGVSKRSGPLHNPPVHNTLTGHYRLNIYPSHLLQVSNDGYELQKLCDVSDILYLTRMGSIVSHNRKDPFITPPVHNTLTVHHILKIYSPLFVSGLRGSLQSSISNRTPQAYDIPFPLCCRTLTMGTSYKSYVMYQTYYTLPGGGPWCLKTVRTPLRPLHSQTSVKITTTVAPAPAPSPASSKR